MNKKLLLVAAAVIIIAVINFNYPPLTTNRYKSSFDVNQPQASTLPITTISQSPYGAGSPIYVSSSTVFTLAPTGATSTAYAYDTSMIAEERFCLYGAGNEIINANGWSNWNRVIPATGNPDEDFEDYSVGTALTTQTQAGEGQGTYSNSVDGSGGSIKIASGMTSQDCKIISLGAGSNWNHFHYVFGSDGGISAGNYLQIDIKPAQTSSHAWFGLESASGGGCETLFQTDAFIYVNGGGSNQIRAYVSGHTYTLKYILDTSTTYHMTISDNGGAPTTYPTNYPTSTYGINGATLTDLKWVKSDIRDSCTFEMDGINVNWNDVAAYNAYDFTQISATGYFYKSAAGTPPSWPIYTFASAQPSAASGTVSFVIRIHAAPSGNYLYPVSLNTGSTARILFTIDSSGVLSTYNNAALTAVQTMSVDTNYTILVTFLSTSTFNIKVNGGVASSTYTTYNSVTTAIDSLTMSGTSAVTGAFYLDDIDVSWIYTFPWADWHTVTTPFQFSITGSDSTTIYIGYNSTGAGGTEATNLLIVLMDAAAPTSSITYTAVYSPNYVTVATTFHMTSSDSGSGIASNHYREDSSTNLYLAPSNLMSGTFTISNLTDGSHTIYYSATDAAGNVQATQSITIILDINAPTPIVVYTPSIYNATAMKGWILPTTSIGLGATDSDSGVAGKGFKITGVLGTSFYQTYQAYSTQFTISNGNGTYQIIWSCWDNCGNNATQSFIIRVDGIGPTVTWSYTSPTTGNSTDWVTAATTFTWSSDDTGGSGTTYTQMKVDGGSWYLAPATGFTLWSNLTTGSHQLQFQSFDNVGNTGMDAHFTVQLDKTTPATIWSYTSPTTGNSTTWISSSTGITWSSTDTSGSGVAYTECKIGSGPYYLAQSTGFTLSNFTSNTAYQIQFYCVSNVGTTSPTVHFTVQLDKTNPVTTFSYTSPEASNCSYIVAATTITWSSTDTGGSGVAYTECKIGSNPYYLAQSSPFNIGNFTDGTYQILFYAVDNVGNTGTIIHFTLTLDKTGPTVTWSYASPTTGNSTSWISATTAIVWSSSDSSSGVKLTECKIGSSSYYLAQASGFTLGNFTDGTYQIQLYAIDNVGNTGTTIHFTVILDKAAPALSVSYSSIYNASSTKGWILPAATITLTSTDSGSGSTNGIENFEIYSSGQDLSSGASYWTVSGTSTNSHFKALSISSNIVGDFYDYDTSVALRTIYTFSTANTAVAGDWIQWNAYVNSLPNTGSLSVVCGQSGDTYTAAPFDIRMNYANSFILNDNGGDHVLFTYTIQVWYTIRVAVISSSTFDVWVSTNGGSSWTVYNNGGSHWTCHTSHTFDVEQLQMFIFDCVGAGTDNYVSVTNLDAYIDNIMQSWNTASPSIIPIAGYKIQGVLGTSFSQMYGTYYRPFSISTNGTYQVIWSTWDNVGNNVSQSFIIRVDTISPTTTNTFATVYTSGSKKWVTSATTFTLGTTDTGGSDVSQNIENFGEYVDGTDLSSIGTPWSVSGTSANAAFKAKLLGSNTVGDFNDNDASNLLAAIHIFSSARAGIAGDWVEFKIKELSETSACPYVELRGTSGVEFLKFQLFITDGHIQIQCADGNDNLQAYSLNIWYVIRITIVSATTFDVSINGTTYNNGGSHWTALSSLNFNSNTIVDLRLYGYNAGGRFEAYYDNIACSWLGKTYFKVLDITASTEPQGWTQYTSVFTLNSALNGTYHIYWCSWDNLGNNETLNGQTVYIDANNPSTVWSYISPTSGNSTNYISGSTTITWSSSDASTGESGVSYTEMKIGTNSWYLAEASPFTLSNFTDGSYQLLLYAVDNVGNIGITIHFTIILDTTVPTMTSISYTSPENTLFGLSNCSYVTGSTIFTMNPSDSGSGIYKAFYKVDSGAYTGISNPGPYTFTLSAAGDGSHQILAYTEDNCGNSQVAGTLHVTIILDDTKPTMTSVSYTSPENTVLGLANCSYVIGSTVFTPSPADSGSGVYEIYWNVDAGAYTAVTSPYTFILGSISDGSHQITVYAEDDVGNTQISGLSHLTVILDNTIPSMTSISYTSTEVSNGYANCSYVTGSTTFTLNPSDGGSDVYAAYYNIDGGSYTTIINPGPYTFVLGVISDGSHQICAYAKDKCGNTQGTMTLHITVILDNTHPTLSISYTTAYVGGNSSGQNWITSATTFTLTPGDAGCGYQSVYYEIASQGYVNKSSPFTFNTGATIDGITAIYAYAVDRCGNSLAVKYIHVTVQIDNTNPISTITYTAVYDSNWVTGTTTFTMNPLDGSGCGISHNYYKEGSNTNLYTAPSNLLAGTFTISNLTDGSHAIYFYSVDNCGNTQSIQSITLNLDKTAPVSTITYTAAYDTNWVSGSTTFTLNQLDGTGSGVSASYYREDSSSNLYTAPANLIAGTFTIANLTDGSHTIYYYSVDNCGIMQSVQNIIIKLDATAPVPSISYSSIYNASATKGWITPSSTIALSATDSGSGCTSGIEDFSEYTNLQDISSISPWSHYDGNANDYFKAELVSGNMVGHYHEPDGQMYNIYKTFGAAHGTVNDEVDFDITINSLGSGGYVLLGLSDTTGNDQCKVEFSYVPGNGYIYFYNGNTFIYHIWTLGSVIHVRILFPTITTVTLYLNGASCGTYNTMDGSISSHKLNQFYLADSVSADVYLDNMYESWETTFNIGYKIQGVLGTSFYKMYASYAAPFSITSNGTYQVIWSTWDFCDNNATQSSIIRVDDMAPSTTIAYTPAYGSNWVNAATTFSLTPITDNSGGSGVASTHYQYTGSGGYHNYAMPFDLSIASNGTITINYYSIDNVGNTETAGSLIVRLDIILPSTSFSYTGVSPGNATNFVSLGITFTLTPVDGGCGVASTHYNINATGYISGTSFDLSAWTNGTIHVLFYSIDNVGNTETAKSFTVRLDTIASITPIGYTPVYSFGGKNWVYSTTTFTLTPADNNGGCGISSTHYKWSGDDGSLSWTSGVSFTLAGMINGTYIISWCSLDYANNNETLHSIIVYISANPTTTLLYTPLYSSGGKDWVSNLTSFSLSAYDDSGPGIAFSYYKWTNGISSQPWSEYIAPFILANMYNGTYIISFCSWDLAGNNETLKSSIVYIDSIKPNTTISYATYNPAVIWHVHFALLAIDNIGGSGVATTEYQISGGLWVIGTSFYLWNNNTWVIAYRSIDHVGNIEINGSYVLADDPKIFIQYHSNITGDPVDFSLVKTRINGTSITTDQPSTTQTATITVYDRFNRALYSKFYNFSASGVYVDIGLNITNIIIQDQFSFPILFHIKINHIDEIVALAVNQASTLQVAQGASKYWVTKIDNVTMPHDVYGNAINLTYAITTQTIIEIGWSVPIQIHLAYYNNNTMASIPFNNVKTYINNALVQIADPISYYYSFTIVVFNINGISLYNSVLNISSTGIYIAATLHVDRTSPITSISFIPVTIIGAKKFVSSTTIFTLSAKDSGSGINSTWYLWSGTGGNQSWELYVAPFALGIKINGTYIIQYKSMDQSGNNETAKLCTIYISSSIYISFTIITNAGWLPYVSSGFGTLANPYIIKNLIFDCRNGNGSSIKSTTVYVSIKNCSMINIGTHGETALKISSSVNILIINLTISGASRGIFLSSDANITIENSSIISCTTAIYFGGTMTTGIIKYNWFMNDTSILSGIYDNKIVILNNYYYEYFTMFPLAITLNVASNVLEHPYIFGAYNDSSPLYWALWYPNTKQITFLEYSNSTGWQISANLFSVYIDNVLDIWQYSTPASILYRFTMIDVFNQVIIDKICNINAGANMAISLPINDLCVHNNMSDDKNLVLSVGNTTRTYIIPSKTEITLSIFAGTYAWKVLNMSGDILKYANGTDISGVKIVSATWIIFIDIPPIQKISQPTPVNPYVTIIWIVIGVLIAVVALYVINYEVKNFQRKRRALNAEEIEER